MLITASVKTPRRDGLTAADRFDREDRGLIWSWEQGRAAASNSHPNAQRAEEGELPQIETWRRGTLLYFAFWVGLRGEDLNIEREGGFAIQCNRTKRWWVFGPEGEWKDKLQGWLDHRYRIHAEVETEPA